MERSSSGQEPTRLPYWEEVARREFSERQADAMLCAGMGAHGSRNRTQFFVLKFRLGSANEPNVSSHCYSVPYMKIPANNQVILGVWLTPFFFVNNIFAGLWLNCSSGCLRWQGLWMESRATHWVNPFQLPGFPFYDRKKPRVSTGNDFLILPAASTWHLTVGNGYGDGPTAVNTSFDWLTTWLQFLMAVYQNLASTVESLPPVMVPGATRTDRNTVSACVSPFHGEDDEYDGSFLDNCSAGASSCFATSYFPSSSASYCFDLVKLLKF